MTTYTFIKEEGKLEGKLEGKTEVIINGYDEGLNISILAKITDLPKKDVLKILLKNNRLEA
jgi:predicted transposase YdaD